jgi:hypothetical protein
MDITAQTQKLRNFILYSPYVLEAELTTPESIRCRFGLIDENLYIEVNEDGIAHLFARSPQMAINLALGPIADCRMISRSLDYFLAGLERNDLSTQLS